MKLRDRLKIAEGKIVGLKRRIAQADRPDSHDLLALDELKAECKELRRLIEEKKTNATYTTINPY